MQSSPRTSRRSDQHRLLLISSPPLGSPPGREQHMWYVPNEPTSAARQVVVAPAVPAHDLRERGYDGAFNL
jgi:hypothetical protein